jgi:Putative peptidoglycan binding domain
MLWYSVLIRWVFLARKLSSAEIKPKSEEMSKYITKENQHMNRNSSLLKAMSAGLLVAAALAIAPGVAMARGGGGGGGGSHGGGGGGFHGGGGGGFHGGGGGGFHGGGGGGFHDGGFAHQGFVSDRSLHFGRGFRHDHDRFVGHHFVFGIPWPGYYDPYYPGSYDYDYSYDNYASRDYSGVILAVQRALAQLGYYHGPLDGVVGPQTEKAIRWFQSVDRLPITGEIDSATVRALRIG